MAQGVTCSRCGAGTPLPDDLRTPAFECAYCHAQLSTAAYAGKDVVSAEQMRAQMTNPRAAQPATPHAFINTRTQAAPCVHCGVVLQVPLDMRAKTVDCPACKRVEPVQRYFADGQRLMLDMQRQIAGNQALARLGTDGVPCSRCGGLNPVTEAAAVQVVCRYCGAPILLSDHVDTSAVARSRLKLGIQEMRGAMTEQQRKQKRLNLIITGVVFGGIALVLLVVFALHIAQVLP
jgi:DNA-directed RNA polymerase subunit RPC12/RpoP